MKTNPVYQLQRFDDDWSVNPPTYKVELRLIGSYDTLHPVSKDSEGIAEDIWDITNISCWARNHRWKYKNLIKKHGLEFEKTEHFSGVTNSDIIVQVGGDLWLAKSFGWEKISDLDEGIYKIIYRSAFINWDGIQNKENFLYEKLLEIKRREA